eukprot:snap_masked-scaffold_12-processed-gene-10.35-mRNA-1 protein AED:1.00 eAED:1.00 QI:0/0/0/0/1/1/3/0/1221
MTRVKSMEIVEFSSAKIQRPLLESLKKNFSLLEILDCSLTKEISSVLARNINLVRHSFVNILSEEEVEAEAMSELIPQNVLVLGPKSSGKTALIEGLFGESNTNTRMVKDYDLMLETRRVLLDKNFRNLKSTTGKAESDMKYSSFLIAGKRLRGRISAGTLTRNNKTFKKMNSSLRKSSRKDKEFNYRSSVQRGAKLRLFNVPDYDGFGSQVSKTNKKANQFINRAASSGIAEDPSFSSSDADSESMLSVDRLKINPGDLESNTQQTRAEQGRPLQKMDSLSSLSSASYGDLSVLTNSYRSRSLSRGSNKRSGRSSKKRSKAQTQKDQKLYVFLSDVNPGLTKSEILSCFNYKVLCNYSFGRSSYGSYSSVTRNTRVPMALMHIKEISTKADATENMGKQQKYDLVNKSLITLNSTLFKADLTIVTFDLARLMKFVDMRKNTVILKNTITAFLSQTIKSIINTKAYSDFEQLGFSKDFITNIVLVGTNFDRVQAPNTRKVLSAVNSILEKIFSEYETKHMLRNRVYGLDLMFFPVDSTSEESIEPLKVSLSKLSLRLRKFAAKYSRNVPLSWFRCIDMINSFKKDPKYFFSTRKSLKSLFTSRDIVFEQRKDYDEFSEMLEYFFVTGLLICFSHETKEHSLLDEFIVLNQEYFYFYAFQFLNRKYFIKAMKDRVKRAYMKRQGLEADFNTFRRSKLVSLDLLKALWHFNRFNARVSLNLEYESGILITLVEAFKKLYFLCEHPLKANFFLVPSLLRHSKTSKEEFKKGQYRNVTRIFRTKKPTAKNNRFRYSVSRIQDRPKLALPGLNLDTRVDDDKSSVGGSSIVSSLPREDKLTELVLREDKKYKVSKKHGVYRFMFEFEKETVIIVVKPTPPPNLSGSLSIAGTESSGGSLRTLNSRATLTSTAFPGSIRRVESRESTAASSVNSSLRSLSTERSLEAAEVKQRIQMNDAGQQRRRRTTASPQRQKSLSTRSTKSSFTAAQRKSLNRLRKSVSRVDGKAPKILAFDSGEKAMKLIETYQKLAVLEHKKKERKNRRSVKRGGNGRRFSGKDVAANMRNLAETLRRKKGPVIKSAAQAEPKAVKLSSPSTDKPVSLMIELSESFVPDGYFTSIFCKFCNYLNIPDSSAIEANTNLMKLSFSSTDFILFYSNARKRSLVLVVKEQSKASEYLKHLRFALSQTLKEQIFYKAQKLILKLEAGNNTFVTYEEARKASLKPWIE